jgi:hypothetical protein
VVVFAPAMWLMAEVGPLAGLGYTVVSTLAGCYALIGWSSA